MSNIQTPGKKKRLGKLSEVIAKGVPTHLQAEWEAHFRKELRSPDLSSVRVVSLEDQFARLANEETVMYNVCEEGGVTKVRDLQHRFRERRIGTDTADVFNPNGDFASESESNRPVRDNTVGFVGTRSNVRFLAQELGQQSPDALNLKAEEIEDGLIRIKRKLNSMLISNTEIKAETVQGGPPQPGGFINRSSLYNLATSGDLTNALIQGRVDAIANATHAEGLGYNIQLMALCHAGQLSKVRDLMIARYPGETSDSHERLKAMLMARIPAFKNLSPDAMEVYKPLPGKPILFVYEPQLPTGNCLFFTPVGKAKPRLGKFEMFGTMGPWALERPEANLLHVTYMWDNVTLIDELVETRALLTGLND